MEKPKEIIELEKKLNIKITEVSEKEDFDSTNSANKNFYLLDDKKRVIGLKLTNFLRLMPNLTQFKDLRYLNLSFNRISTIQHLDHLIKLEELDLSNNELGISKITGLEKLIHLKILRLKENQIKVISGLENLKSLDTLDLTNNQITKIEGLENLELLNKLYLGKNQLSKIEGLENLLNLECLWLYDNRISKITGLDKLKSLIEVFIGGNQISMIEGLEKLTQLKALSISKNQLSKIEGLENLVKLEELWLTENKIEKIEGLESLTKIQYLSIGDNCIKQIINLDSLTQLTHLNLKQNEIHDINGLAFLKELKFLNLDDNQIEDISPLEDLKQLEDLSLISNKLKDLTPIYFLIKNNIKSIDIEDNKTLKYPPFSASVNDKYYIIKWFDLVISSCNEKIKKAKINHDTEIDLGMMGLTDLSLIPELFELENLEELILSNHYAKYNEDYEYWERINSENIFYPNNIYNIPNDIVKLKNLKKIFAGGDWKDSKNEDEWNRWRIKDISFINKLVKIEFINVSNNEIESFKITRELINLKTIHINNNRISSISVSRARNLEYLFASNNHIESLNFLVKSLQLKALDLHSNMIKDLFPIKKLIEKIGILNDQWEYNAISIAKNNLENPGIEVVDLGKDAVLKMMEINYGERTFINNEVKLILVGNSEVGKTTLSKYLAKDPNYKDKHPFTLWLKILEVYNKNDIIVNVFDFGGHEYFHDTHHIFFTKNCIYFLVWDKPNDQYNIRDLNQIDADGKTIKLQTIDYPISYWLDSINHFIKERVTDNFSDEMKKDFENTKSYSSSALIIQNKVNNIEDVKFLNQNDINVNYPFIFDFIQLDFHNEKNLSLLHHRFEEMISNLGKVSGGRYPIYYKNIKENIKKFKGYQNKKIINYNEFKKLCQTFKRELTSDDEFIQIANYLKNIGLILFSKDEKTFYLDLNFISNQIIKIYDGLQNTDGILSEKKIKEKNIEDYENIIKLILDNNMAFEININKEKNYIFPLYLPKEPSKLVQLMLRENVKIYKRLVYDGFMHKGIILHIFSEYSNSNNLMSDEIEKNTYFWKNGLIVKEKDNLVLIKFFDGFEGNNIKNAHIDLYNYSNNDLLVEKISEKIIKLNKENNYLVKEYVSNDGQNFIPLELINDNEMKNMTILFEDKKYSLNDFTKYFKNKNIMKKMFISYSKHDTDYKNEFVKHLITLKDENLVDPFNCDEIGLGENSHEVIQKKLKECDFMIALVSIDYLNTDYIRNFEIDIAENLGKKIIPVIIKPCDWENSKLGKYHATLRGKNISLDNHLFLKGEIKETTPIERAARWNQIMNEFRDKLFM